MSPIKLNPSSSSSSFPSYNTNNNHLAQPHPSPLRHTNNLLLNSPTPSEMMELSVSTPPPKTFTPSPPMSREGSGGGGGGASNGFGSLGRSTGEGELGVLLRTLDFAARKHSCQRRKDVDQTPYINHPIAVANFLSSTGVTDVRVLQAAILHDTVEDTHTTVEEIAQLFGTDVARIVEECTDNTELSGQQRKIEQLRTAPYKSKEAQQVKLADKMHNLESIRRSPPVGWGVKRIQAYFIWAKQVTDVCGPAHPPLARQLQNLYETAYTRVNGVYYPCHPEVCGPLTEEEQELVDSRLRSLKEGDQMCPEPLFF
ncbi:hypothetical protein CI109_102999 [Kwoniella shandongensis]|uniref:Guanosine-3',5'-bis(diphosphate) 3'-pyrophosphohydrolase MESH1 n=1 Tax=Kwoniella shandongensis TaxID=1734106 RepID=A0A5M6CD15_9TREE|nr:uncharacterized protein CI109_000186 [Kwoniella shandongensis]KAA5531345.1 hypothetical protein CI109_000186 [Kwoniella shandongensis]